MALFRRSSGLVLVVTSHESLRRYLIEEGYISPDTPHQVHANKEDVRGKHVIGKLPLSVAAAALDVTEVPLALVESDRRKGEIPLIRLREVAGAPQVFQVIRKA